jgi:Fuc2NAc and GlcNAc transferase
MTAIVLMVVSMVLSAVSVGYIRRLAIAHQMIDIPNERSSHEIPTPRGGGLAVVVIVLLATVMLLALNELSLRVGLGILVGAGVALVGYLDDRSELSPLQRGLTHLGIAILGIILIGGMPALELGFAELEWGVVGHVVGVVGIVWMINLYNFMDGIDGIAGSEALFIFGSATLLLMISDLNNVAGLSLLSAVIVGAALGFLWWNWSPARIFMGDVASGFLGYLIAIIAIASAHASFSLWVWLILGGAFVIDATVTLLLRVARGEKWYTAHREHLYQQLSRQWGQHQSVTMTLIALNLLWLLPLAVLAAVNHDQGSMLALIALLPLLAGRLWLQRLKLG